MPNDTIMVIEDDMAIRPHLVAILRDEGYAVLEAGDGAAALAMLEAEPPPRVILLDLMMPIMDGWSFRAAQRARPALAPIPVVVLSGAADLEQGRPPLQARATLRKPFDLDHLLTLLAEICADAPAGS